MYNTLAPTTLPEIARVDLSTPILQLKSLGINNLMKFDWITAPPSEAVLRSLEGLVGAGMITDDGELTSAGEKVAEVPLDINIARMLFASKEHECGQEILTIAAMVTVQVSDLCQKLIEPNANIGCVRMFL
jgi:ATP-dependent RNA helicase DDX35